ncbi:CHRD domain-containing protein [Peristeroidobacter agariperforans]|uniref:CHRD domain-containing protein n=1 Tax=Peristeroidobacter agariperforans TaxID=268404 RepID=UPI00101DC6D2|nr:CHRD domain-containing protein [Peristeroidobacter agariperforans]
MTHRAGKIVGRTLLALGVFAVSFAASAEDVKVTLTGAEEVPAVTTTAMGEGTIAIGKDMSVSGTVKTKGIEGVAAHIHLAEAGKNGPPVVTLIKGEGGAWTTPPGAKLTEEQYQAFKAGKLYVNVHSAAHKGGEIRGQLKP